MNVGAWEKVVNDLAIHAGINTAESQVKKFSNHNHTFLSKRFDRRAGNKRLHFASAMTLLQYTDGDDATDEVSYLELAEFIIGSGANPKKDLEKLWRRIVFFICISNTDDHLRNHGFVLTSDGWSLSPAYDMNPIPHSTGLRINISETDNSLDLEIPLQVAPYFRISNKRAEEILVKVKDGVKNWRKIAEKYGINRSEQDRMAAAFIIP